MRVTAAGVTPLEYTILSGGHPRAKPPLVLGNEGAGVIEDAGNSGFAVGSRVMFTGPYGVGEDGTWQEWLLVRPEHLARAPDAIDEVVAASLPVAYLTAQVTLTLAGFKPGMTVLAPGIGGSVGNAAYQLARAQGAGKVISTAGSAAKAAKARTLGFEDVIDLSGESLADGARRITAGKGVDIVIESIGGTVTSEALSSLGVGGVLITLGYSAGRKTTIDVTDLIWKRARMIGKLTKAADGHRIGAAEVRCRIKDVKLRPLQDVRLESQAAAIVGDLEHEIVSMAPQATSDWYHELPGDGALLAELAEIIPTTAVLVAEESLPEIAALTDDGADGLPGYAVETRVADALLEEAAIILAMDQNDDLEVADDAEMAAADMIDALISPAMVPDGEDAFEEETGYGGRPNQSESTGQTWGDEFTEDDNAGRTEHSEYLDDVHRDTREYASYRGADGQDCRTSAGRPVDAETPSGEEFCWPS